MGCAHLMDGFWSQAAAFWKLSSYQAAEVAEPSWHNRGEACFLKRNHSPSGHKALLRQLGHLEPASSWGRWGEGRESGRQKHVFTTKTRQESTGVTGVSRPAGWGSTTDRRLDHSPKALMESLLATDLGGLGSVGLKSRSRFPAEQLHASEHRDTALQCPVAFSESS